MFTAEIQNERPSKYKNPWFPAFNHLTIYLSESFNRFWVMKNEANERANWKVRQEEKL